MRAASKLMMPPTSALLRSPSGIDHHHVARARHVIGAQNGEVIAAARLDRHGGADHRGPGGDRATVPGCRYCDASDR